ncbi:hypothetical protein [Amycolatopsis sp. NPDC003861]
MVASQIFGLDSFGDLLHVDLVASTGFGVPALPLLALRVETFPLLPSFCGGEWWPTDGQSYLFDPGQMRIIRYRCRGTKTPTPWTATN